jgi:hypothetical protein
LLEDSTERLEDDRGESSWNKNNGNHDGNNNEEEVLVMKRLSTPKHIELMGYFSKIPCLEVA